MPQPTIVVITATITIAKFNNWREDPGLVPGLSFARRVLPAISVIRREC
jgi:hypothetical protein